MCRGIVVLGFALATVGVRAQDLEPRAYVNTPVGLNFLIAGYAYSQGGLSTDPALPIEDAHLKIHGAVFAYARSLDVWGKAGKFDVIVPYAQLSGSALVAGEPRDREVAERLDSSYPYMCGEGAIIARHFEYSHNGKRLFHGDTAL